MIMNDEPTNDCNQQTWPENAPKIFLLREDILVAIPDDSSNITTSCSEDDKSSIKQPSIIKFTNCTVSDGMTTWMTSQRGRMTRNSRAAEVSTLALSPPNVNISTYHQDAQLNKWRNELQKELDTSDNWLQAPGYGKYWQIGMIIVAALMILSPLLKLCLPRRPREEDHQETTTPAIAPTRWSLEYLASLNKVEA